jgi:hypothetical protein
VVTKYTIEANYYQLDCLDLLAYLFHSPLPKLVLGQVVNIRKLESGVSSNLIDQLVPQVCKVRNS